MKRRVAVLISGRGSNLKALIDAAAAPDYPAEIALVVSNRADAPGLQHAAAAGIAAEVIPHRDFADRESYDAALDEKLRAAEIDLVCLAGFMRILSAGFVSRWHGRMINIHPSLLPAFKGLAPQQQAIDAGARLSGCTVHFVTAEMDDGPALLQAAVPIDPDDDANSLAARILAVEHRAYPAALRWLATGMIGLDPNGRVTFSEAGKTAPNSGQMLANPPITS